MIKINSHLERDLHVHLDELVAASLAHGVAVFAVRGDERYQRDHAAVREQFADFADATDVFLAVFGGESEVGVEAVADIVAVEHLRDLAALEERVLEGVRDGGLGGGGGGDWG